LTFFVMLPVPADESLVTDSPLDRCNSALKAAADEVIEEHARNGWPIYVWEDGKVVAIPDEQLTKDLPKQR
jgi:hypothetical protein